MAQGLARWGNVSTDFNTTENGTRDNGTTVNEMTVLNLWILDAIWLLYCCHGEWTLQQPLRIVAVILGTVKCIVTHVWQKDMGVTLSWFATYLLGRMKFTKQLIDQIATVALVIWMITDTVAIFLTAAKWIDLALEALAVTAMLTYHLTLAMALQPKGRAIWLRKVCAVVGWGIGWGILSIIHWSINECTVLIMAWFMWYGAVFPVKGESGGGQSPPPQLHSPFPNRFAVKRFNIP